MRKWMQFVLITNILAHCAVNKFNVSNNHFSYKLGLCFKHLLGPQFKDVVGLIRDDLDYSVDFTGWNRQMLLLNLSQNIQMEVKLPQNIIIITKDVKSLNETITKMQTKTIWHRSNSPRAKYVIVIYGQQKIYQIFKHLWDLDVIKVLVLSWNNLTVGFEAFTSSPYGENECGRFTHLNQIDVGKDTDPFGTPNKFSGCSLVGGLLDKLLYWPYLGKPYSKLPGLVITIWNNIFRKLNISAEYKSIRKEIQENFTILGFNSVHPSSMKEYDMIVSLANRYTWYYDRYDLSEVYYVDEGVWIAQKPSLLPNVKLILVTFSKGIWLCVLLAGGLVPVLLLIIMRCNKDRSTYKECLTHIFAATLGQSFAAPKGLAARILVMFYLLYSLNINQCFQGKLSSVLTDPGYEKGINSVEELVNSNLKPYIFVFIKRGLEMIDTPLARELLSKSILLNNGDFEYRLQKVAEGQMASTAYKSGVESFPYYNKKIKMIGRNFLLNMEMVLSLRHGHPFMERFNEVISQITEAGLQKKWMSEMKKAGGPEDEDFGRQAVILTKQHVQGAFIILLLGTCISFIVFIAELCVSHIKK